MKNFFSHDEGARNDPRLIKVLMRLGQAGKGVYWDIIEMLYEQDGYLQLDECESYAFALRTECDLLAKLLSDFGLFENDGTRFWSASVLRRLAQRKGKSAKASESAAKRWGHANALPPHSEGNAKKGKEKKGKETTSDDVARAGGGEDASQQVATASPPSPQREVPADEAPVFTVAGFGAFVARMAYGQINRARYLLDIQRKAETLKARTNTGWENYILEWLRRDEAAGHLLLAEVKAPPGGPVATTSTYDRKALAAQQQEPVC
jgi:hypothetical protein